MSIQTITTIVLLIVIIGIAGFIVYTYFQVRKKIRRVSKELFGTSNIANAASEMKKEYSTTPKSVSAMTSLLLPKISADFPDFEYNEMKNRSDNVLTSYLRAINERNVGILKDGNSELKHQLENHIEMLKGQGLREHFEQIHLHRTEINQYRKDAGRCIITFQSSLECYHYITDENGNIKSGEKEYKYQTKYNVDLIYIQDREQVENDLDHALGLNCPNCGAPISNLGAKHCEYCGTSIIEINIHAWSFCNVEEIN